MNHRSGKVSTPDQFELFWQFWMPETPKAIVYLLHGLADHSGRFAHVAEQFGQHQIATYAIDLRGHGHSSGTSAYVKSIDEYLIDTTTGFEHMQSMNIQKLPLFIYGHSMGSLVAIKCMLNKQDRFQGLITSATLVKANTDLSPILVKLSGVIAALLPKIKTVKLDLTQLSSDQSVGRAAADDPLYNTDGIRAGTGKAVLDATANIQHNLKHLKLPVLIMHGEEDKITLPESSQLLYNQVVSEDKEIHIIPDARHEIVNEVNKEDVLNKMVTWMLERVDS